MGVLLRRLENSGTETRIINASHSEAPSLYGGRSKALRLHYKIAENEETTRYSDVMCLYPYICMYFKFPIGHPVVHVCDTCKDIRACLQMEGLIKCTIVPPMDLYHPLLPFRCNKKLLFCLCRTCAFEHARTVSPFLRRRKGDQWHVGLGRGTNGRLKGLQKLGES